LIRTSFLIQLDQVRSKSICLSTIRASCPWHMFLLIDCIDSPTMWFLIIYVIYRPRKKKIKGTVVWNAIIDQMYQINTTDYSALLNLVNWTVIFPQKRLADELIDSAPYLLCFLSNISVPYKVGITIPRCKFLENAPRLIK